MLISPRIVIFGALLAGASAQSAGAEDLPVDLELVLAVDISGSMRHEEQELQRQGYVDALQSPGVLRAIREGALGRIAVAYVEWADPSEEEVVVPWTLIDGPESARRVSSQLAAAPRRHRFGTSISAALLFSSGLFDGNGFAGERKAIDISGNGPNALGPPVEPIRDFVVARGVTINGLPIMIRITTGEGLYSIVGLDFYFEDCVIGGPGAFTVAVKKASELASAIERKLTLEISARPESIVPIAKVIRPKHMDCLAGEKGGGRLLPAN